MKVYGLTKCGTCKKAKAWLDENGIAYRFYDWRDDGLDADMLAGWIAEYGPEKIVNKAGYTWRGLSDADKDRALGADTLSVLSENPALVKRPAFVTKNGVLFGFSKKVQAALSA